MKRGAPEAGTPWQQLCARLGVQPKQFAVLLAVAGGGLVLLGGKWMLSGPKSAAAKPTPAAAAAPAPAPAVPGEGAGTTPAHGATEETSGSSDQAIEVRLDSQPRRDPFKSFIERGSMGRADASLVGAPGDTPLDLAIFRLRATMDAQWAVINDQTLRVGDPIGVGPDGLPIVLTEVGHRRIVVEWRGRRFDLSFAGTAPGGAR